MKEKIWMEKLIELLNEYEREKIIHRTYYLVSWYIMYKRDDGEEVDDKRTDLEIISKSYGFIKWLVDNDKINWRKCLDLWYEISVIDEEWEDIDVMRTFDSYEQLLMYLAIQDNPIEFLVSILK